MLYPDERRILLTPGPVVFSSDVLRYMLSTSYEHTSPDFAEIFSSAIKGFRKLIEAPPESLVFLLPGSGSLAMEAALINIAPRGSKVLIISNGYFGDRWAEIASLKGYKVDVIRADHVGGVVSTDLIAERISREEYTAILANHVETSTGVRIDLYELAKIARNTNSVLIVDGVSSVGAEPLKANSWGVDVIITASQKALETPPGIGIICICSKKALEAFEKTASQVDSFYMKLAEWRKIMEAYEVGSAAYFATPPTHLIVALAKALEKIHKEGVENRYTRHRILARALRAGLKGMGLEIVARSEEIASNTITAVYTPPGIDPMEIRKEMIRGNIAIAGPLHPQLKGKSIRIGHMGAVNHNDIVSAIALLERVLKKLGARIELGSGIRAVQEALYNAGL
ncbi:MAG: alanine--glyoxylate aminotransferase family protein [Sulfolobales archaeon]